mmetsp:Transcript_43842/g.171431  ORF Transcript_43842/g.171431 Transcript_43842/m.171431 type:complete len:96 (-) Transcript_43842:456-743(-)
MVVRSLFRDGSGTQRTKNLLQRAEKFQCFPCSIDLFSSRVQSNWFSLLVNEAMLAGTLLGFFDFWKTWWEIGNDRRSLFQSRVKSLWLNVPPKTP